MKKIVLLFSVLASLQADAAIYMQKDNNGDVTYSDVPINNAQPVSLLPANTVPATNTQTTTNASTTTPSLKSTELPTDKPTHLPYQTFTFTFPKNGDTIQNQTSFTVKTESNPELQSGDTIQIYLDGQPWGAPATTSSINMENVSRGEHQLYAQILDSNKQILKQTNTITIYVHRPSTNFKPAEATPARNTTQLTSN